MKSFCKALLVLFVAIFFLAFLVFPDVILIPILGYHKSLSSEDSTKQFLALLRSFQFTPQDAYTIRESCRTRGGDRAYFFHVNMSSTDLEGLTRMVMAADGTEYMPNRKWTIERRDPSMLSLPRPVLPKWFPRDFGGFIIVDARSGLQFNIRGIYFLISPSKGTVYVYQWTT